LAVSYDQWRSYLEGVAADYDRQIYIPSLTGWLEHFYGLKVSEYHVILAPAIFGWGGYGPLVTAVDGRIIAFAVIRENGISRDVPRFPDGAHLQELVLHELSHTYVSLSLSPWRARLRELNPLFAPVRSLMTRKDYPTVESFAAELFNRGVVTYAVRSLRGEPDFSSALQRHQDEGFTQVSAIVTWLDEYRENRAVYPGFADFAPVMIDKLKTAPPNYGPLLRQVTLYGFLLVAAIIGFLWYRAISGRGNDLSSAPLADNKGG
jgi:hypothetical protein